MVPPINPQAVYLLPTPTHLIYSMNLSTNLQGGPKDKQQICQGEISHVQEEPLGQWLPEEHDVRLHHTIADRAARHPVRHHISLGRQRVVHGRCV
jgi:hypothetical protein